MFRNTLVAVAIGVSMAVPVSGVAADDARSTAANAFNPAISLIVSGQYSHQQLDPQDYRIGGFIPGGEEVGPGARGFSIGESELTLSANIDPYLSGYFVLSVSGENSVSVEEGVIQNAGLVPGVSLKLGRMLAGFGYLNEQHAHAWDFTDAPLVHQAFFGGKLQEDGLQARWLAPTPLFVELGAETGRGAGFPGSERNTRRVPRWSMHSPVTAACGVWISYGSGRPTATLCTEISSWLRNTYAAPRTAPCRSTRRVSAVRVPIIQASQDGMCRRLTSSCHAGV